MKWYHFSVEYFEDLRNVNHCEFLIMRKSEENGKYILQNPLRTWSELKLQQIAASKDTEATDDAINIPLATATTENGEESESKNYENGKAKVIEPLCVKELLYNQNF